MIYFILLYLFAYRHSEAIGDKHLRGAVTVTQEQMAEILNNSEARKRYKISPIIKLPERIVANRNFCMGRPGSGKSQLIYRIVEQLIEQNFRCIIHDFKGDFIPIFYDSKKHYIFNPLDIRHMGLNDKETISKKGWTLFNDLKTLNDVESFVASMIPNASHDQFWSAAPRDILKSILIYCKIKGKNTNNDICKMLYADADTLKNAFTGVEGCEEGLQHLYNPNLSQQLKSVMSSFTSPLRYLKNTDGDFSIKDWIKDTEAEKRIIFVSNQADVQDTLRPLITTFFDFSTKALLSLPDDPHNPNRKLFFILDEFGQLTKMNSIIQLLSQCRSKGGAAWLLAQDLKMIKEIYGENLAHTIINNCGNKFYFGVDDESTADFISKEIGTSEIQRRKESASFDGKKMQNTTSENNDIIEHKVVLPSEVRYQKDLNFYMLLTNHPITQVNINYINFPSHCEAYEPRDMFLVKEDKPVENAIDQKPNDTAAGQPESALSQLSESNQREEEVSENAEKRQVADELFSECQPATHTQSDDNSMTKEAEKRQPPNNIEEKKEQNRPDHEKEPDDELPLMG
jgi:type IV secretory pathway TraG/TraD family ATPase VirD4